MAGPHQHEASLKAAHMLYAVLSQVPKGTNLRAPLDVSILSTMRDEQDETIRKELGLDSRKVAQHGYSPDICSALSVMRLGGTVYGP